MGKKDQPVEIPSYAKKNRKGEYYALKRDIPYFAEKQDKKGYFVIGSPSEEEGKMIPGWNYFRYCSQEAITRKEEEERQRIELEAEEEAELKRTFGEVYVSLNALRGAVSCRPVNGFLTEKFFSETGLSAILDDVFTEEKAHLIKLSAAVLAAENNYMTFDGLNSYPMRLHMRYSMDRYMLAGFWSAITEEEMQEVYRKWIRKVNPEAAAAQYVEFRMTLYHNRYSDQMSDGWFSTRMRTGTQYDSNYLIYRDVKTETLLAAERLRYDYDWTKLDTLAEIHTIEHSQYPQLRNASVHYFMYPYLFHISEAMKDRPVTAWIHPTEHPDQKEMNKKLKLLEKQPVESGVRILRWQGSWKETEGQWILAEIASRREGIENCVRNVLTNYKRQLEAMSYHSAILNHNACYFDIEKGDDEPDIFGSAPFRVKSVPGASAMVKKDFGRFLCFSTEPPLSDREIMKQLWKEEDLMYQYNTFMNHGETADITDEFSSAMAGRELPLFLASIYRDWICDRVGDLFNDNYDVREVVKDLSRWRCEIHRTGEVCFETVSEKIESLLQRFGVTPEDVKEYLSDVIHEKKYFSETFKEW